MSFTPAGLHLDDLLLVGIGTLFGGIVVAAGIGVLVGRFSGGVKGLATALLLWGVGNLLVAGVGMVLVHVDSQVITLPVARCVPSEDGRKRSYRELWYRLPSPAANGEPRHVHLGRQPGACASGTAATMHDRIRVRSDELASNQGTIRGDFADDDKPAMLGVLWGVFGGAGVLMGLLILGNGSPRRPPVEVRDGVAVGVAPWRRTIGELLGGLGLMLFLAAFIAPFFIDGSIERQLQLGMRSVAAAMGCWIVAGLLGGGMTWGAALFLLAFGGAMLGFAELIKHTGLE